MFDSYRKAFHHLKRCITVGTSPTQQIHFRNLSSSPVSVKKSLVQRESLSRIGGEEKSPEILMSFHSSGLTSNQWRKLKNLWFPGRTQFQPSCREIGKKNQFFTQLAQIAGPTCILYLPKEASDRKKGAAASA
ncbi:Ribosomal protein L10 [Quillaja saponaria]|uniref:Ribosomal protein L10 n=1 Tax=Quillaja saponaria TaxID=32244 RepID=A0AAD7QEY8_QUISA|nr:Ribosomal protein L10 [Quillaja saponaria]